MQNTITAVCIKCGGAIDKNSNTCTQCGRKTPSLFPVQFETSYPKLIGNLAVKNKMISKDNLTIIYSEYMKSLKTDNPKKIEDILLEKKLVSLENLSKLIAATLRTLDKQFCNVAIKKGLINLDEAKEVMAIQGELYKKGVLKAACDIFAQKQKLTKADINSIFNSPEINIDAKKSPRAKTEKQYKPLKKIWKDEDKKQTQGKAKSNLPAKSLKLGRLAVKHNYLSQPDFEKSIQDWSALISTGKSDIDFLTYLVNQNLIDRKKQILINIHYDYENLKELDIMFCKLAILYNLLSQHAADEVIKSQAMIFREKHKLISVPEILNQKKLLTGKQIYKILLEQKRTDLAEKFHDKLNLSQKPSTGVRTAASGATQETDENISLEITDDKLEVSLTSINQGVTSKEVKEALDKRGIVFGVLNNEVIQSHIDESNFPIKIAFAKKPIQPVHAEIICHFAENYLDVGSIDEKGNIDFKDRGEVPFVQPDQLLAEKREPEDGENGIDVFGNEILVEEARDIDLEAGSGTRLSESDNKVYAIENGKPHLSFGGKISVYNIHEIKGDVDYKTGHIEFNGSIKIHGTVKPGFKVIGNDIEVNEIQDGIIESKGHVVVKGGVSGAKIKADHGLKAKYIASSEITAFGDVISEKEIIESDIKTSGIISANSGKIISSKIYAKGGVDAKQIGTEISDPSTIEVGSSKYLESLIAPILEKMEELNENIQKYTTQRKKIEKEHHGIHMEIAEKAQIHDKTNQALSELNSKYDLIMESGNESGAKQIRAQLIDLEDKLKKYDRLMDELFEKQDSHLNLIFEYDNKIKANQKEKESLQKDIDALKNFDSTIPPSPAIVVNGTIEKGTRVVGPNSVWVVHDTAKRIRAFEAEGRNQNGDTVYIFRTEKIK